MSHIRLFEHPASRAMLSSTLSITGALPSAIPSAAYEGRLQVNNASGDFTAWLVSGTLPPGSTVSADNVTDEVVVAWPAYSAGYVSVPNNSAQAGDLRGWEAGAGWSYDASGGARFKFHSATGSSIILSTFRAAVTPGQSITASVQVDQGASSKGNAGACVLLQFFDGLGNRVGAPVEGNMISSASNSAVYPSSVTAGAPAGATSVSIGSRAFRKRQNKALWVDDFAWNVTTASVGINADATIGPITIRATDSTGRTADWTGTITVQSITSNQLNPSYKSATIVLSNSDKTSAHSYPNAAGMVRSIDSHSSGKRYFEATVDAVPPIFAANGWGSISIGLVEPSVVTSNGMVVGGAGAFAVFMVTDTAHNVNFNVAGNGSEAGVNSALAAPGIVLGIAVDIDTRRWWLRVGGVWQKFGSGALPDPATNTDPTLAPGFVANLPAAGATLYIGIGFAVGAAGGATINTGTSPFAHAIPAGFKPWAAL